MKFFIVLNRIAAEKKEKIKLVNKVYDLLKEEHTVEIFETHSEQEAKKVFEDVSKKEFDRIIVAGGDGSICLAINEMINNGINNKFLGYIPAGTANILEIEAQITRKANIIFKALTSDRFKKINLAKINNKYFFLMAGIGFDSKIVESINNKSKKMLGKLIFAFQGFKHFLFLKNNKMRVEINSEIILADWILCTNSKYYAGPYSITKETNIFESKIIAYIFKDLTRIKLLHYVWLVLTKGDLGLAKSVIKKDLNKLHISGINNKILAQVDGENYSYNEKFVIKKTDKYINFLVP